MATEAMNSERQIPDRMLENARRCAEKTGKTFREFEQAVHAAVEATCLTPVAAWGRLLWLVDPDGPGTIGLLSAFPELGAGRLADAVSHPSDAVLSFIQAKTRLDRGFLEEVFREAGLACRYGREGWIADLTEERILQEMKWWTVDLTLPEYYFVTTPPREIARQIVANRFFETSADGVPSAEHVKLSYISPTGTTIHWVHRSGALELEEEIEREYYRTGNLYHIATYAVSGDLLLTIVESTEPPSGAATFDSASPVPFEAVAPKNLLPEPREDAEQRRTRYHTIWNEVLETGRFSVHRSAKPETGEWRVMIGFPVGKIRHFLANIYRLMLRDGIGITRKYTLTFGGTSPIIVTTLYAHQEFQEDLEQELVDTGLYPATGASRLVESNTIRPAEAIFLHAACAFVSQFATTDDPNIDLLRSRFPPDSEPSNIVRTIKARMDRDTYRYDTVLLTFLDRPDLIHALYDLFEARLDPARENPQSDEARIRDGIEKQLASTALSERDSQVLRWGLRFVDSILRTNFFFTYKTAVSFRLSSEFSHLVGFKTMPHAVFLVVGREFYGFHIRFKEIARGGIRIVHSATYDDYAKNASFLFEECYNLAFTQNLKNKDIPEGGSKGVILLDFGCSRSDGEFAFRAYTEAILDLLIPEGREAIRNYEEEILFFGPDEGSAELMDWAAVTARRRGYRYWKAFTTGKASDLGGISHIDYGMTTRGIHQYVLGILRELGIREEDITKAQTGGPDGDLGSNEILISRDGTTVIVDGGGVLYDPDGLDRGELERLARLRTDSTGFDRAKLGPRGFKVQVSDRDVTLPDGTRVVSGYGFRNTIHLDRRMKADLFVPCGGRPASITSANWKALLDDEGRPVFRWIVEGANLFITQDARIKLEEKGVVLFKDSSTNKGGVISSSYEVLVSLALTDGEHDRLMTVSDTGKVPEFRERYIRDVIAIIEAKAALEFQLLWNASRKTGAFISDLSNRLSVRINEITDSVERSTLFDDIEARRNVFRRHIPASLLDEVGIDAILERLPESYQRAVFARTFASLFVYRYSLEADFEDYRLFSEEIRG